jgi:hypothetical protein
VVLTIVILAGLVQDGRVAVPPSWVPRVVAELKQDGLLVGYDDGMMCWRGERPPSASRYECAAAGYAAYMKLEQLRLQPGARERLGPRPIESVLRLIREFRPELQGMGLDEDSKPAYSQILVDLISWKAVADKEWARRFRTSDASTNDVIPKPVESKRG